MVNYIKNTSGLNTQDNAFIISNEEELKKLLFGISERYYETPISKQLPLTVSAI